MPRRDAATVRLAGSPALLPKKWSSGDLFIGDFGGPAPGDGNRSRPRPACRDTAAPASSLPGGRPVDVSLPYHYHPPPPSRHATFCSFHTAIIAPRFLLPFFWCARTRPLLTSPDLPFSSSVSSPPPLCANDSQGVK